MHLPLASLLLAVAAVHHPVVTLQIPPPLFADDLIAPLDEAPLSVAEQIELELELEVESPVRPLAPLHQNWWMMMMKWTHCPILISHLCSV